MQPQRKYVSIAVEELLEYGFLNVFSVRDPCRRFMGDNEGRVQPDPCGGGVEYLHRDPASRRRRQKYGREIHGTRDSRKTALARASSIYNRRTRPLVREGAPQKQDCNCQTIINIWL
jgi:hypothetical protein